MNLRARLSLGAAALAALAVAAAVVAVVGLQRTERLAAEAMAAQHRIESYSSLSARVNEWVMGRLGAREMIGDVAVTATLDLLDALVAEDIAAAPAARDRAGQRMVVASLRGHFAQLQSSLSRHPLPSPEATAAIGFYAAQVPAVIAGQIQQDARRREAAMEAMGHLRQRLRALAIGIAVAAPLVLALLHLLLLRPLIRRLRLAGVGPDTAHDELSLALARIRRRTNRLDRGQRRLEATIAARTEELREANARLSAVDARRRRFFADVSHELRTPLTVIMGEAELGGSFATIQARAQRLYRRIEDLLRIARSDSGQLDLESAAVDLPAVIAAAEADLAPVLRRAGVVVQTRIAPAMVRGDADWLRQVFAGIMENTARHAPRSNLRIEAADGTVTFTDDGPGLPPGSAMTERFAKGGGRGFGVGLALARWVIEAHGGTLALDSPGIGLRLTITLPLAHRAEEAA
ncbi:sensor histidine kinase [Falsirhodobacter xinxiangensis]|uniref:sensor histidine kinase n=1 Tax=Falsirhodobacter xinxiangensis TaxID=2530049 RepID=UPI00145C0677|nr:HAMP domain-containing sensor histidine kinase [Rhodobacter xinxiangensis]